MTAGSRTRSLTDLAVFGIISACGMLAAASSDREFLIFRAWLATQGQTYSKTMTGVAKYEAPISRVVQDGMAVLYATGPGLLFIAYRPRGSRRPRRRGPGHVAIAIAGGLIVYSMAHYCWFMAGPTAWTGYQPGRMPGRPTTIWTGMLQGNGDSIAHGIAASWIYLAAIRGWRGSRAPVERLGILYGLCWILATVTAWGVKALLMR